MITPTVNKSQQLFEEFCKKNLIPIHPIKRSFVTGRKTPDYEILISRKKIVVEVKELNPNPEDKKHIETFKKTGMTGTISVEPGQRVRKAIDEAIPQLKSWSCKKTPSILVLYNNIPLFIPYLDPQHILTGMYGVEEVVIINPQDHLENKIRWFHRFAGKRKVSTTHNTTLSALSVLNRDNDQIVLDVYINDYAANKINPNWLRIPCISYYKLGPVAEVGGLRTWKKI